MLASQRLANIETAPNHTQQQLHLANICGIRSGNKVDVFKTTVKQKRMYRLLATSWLARQQGGVHIKTHKNTFDTNRIFDNLCASLLARHPLGQGLASSCLPSSCPPERPFQGNSGLPSARLEASFRSRFPQGDPQILFGHTQRERQAHA